MPLRDKRKQKPTGKVPRKGTLFYDSEVANIPRPTHFPRLHADRWMNGQTQASKVFLV